VSLKPPLPPSSPRKIIYVYIEAFLAAVELHENTDLQDLPVLVGNESGDKVKDASPEARALGALPGMSLNKAMRLCPQAHCVIADFAKYRRANDEMHALLLEYTDLVENIDLGESHLDVTYNKQDIPFGRRVAQLIKSDLHHRLGLTAKISIAPNKLIAKLASAVPNGDRITDITEVLRADAAEFIADLPIDLLPGIGPVLCRKISREFGVSTLGQVAKIERDILYRTLGRRGARLWEMAHGRDDEAVCGTGDVNTLDQEVTFPAAIFSAEDLHDALRQLVDGLGGRLRRRQLHGRLLSISVRYANGDTTTRAKPLPQLTDQNTVLLREALDLLLQTAAYQHGVRGLRLELATGGDEQGEQLDLFSLSPSTQP
jgi:DNA polymerase-4